jgi:hypothetical protein
VNPSHRLEDLNRAANRRIAKLRARVSNLKLPVNFDDDARVAWTVIEARNLWAGFLRAYYLSGAIRTRTRSGKPVRFTSRVFPDLESALRFAVRLKNPSFQRPRITRYDEPPWHNTKNFIKVHQKVGATNLSQIYAALGIGSGFIQRLTDLRNFYAHRCDETFRAAANVGVSLGFSTKPELRATKILCSRLPKRPQNVITDWLDDMANVFDLLCS